MLTEETLIDKIEVLSTGFIQVRYVNRILKDGNVVAETFHRYSIQPGADLSNEDTRIRAIAEAAWHFLPKG